MRKIIQVILASLAVGGLFAVPAHADQTAYVSAIIAATVAPGIGCPATAPCATIAQGITAINGGGDVVIMDSATYPESLTISKSVKIISPHQAIIAPPSGSSAFILNTANASLILSGLIIDGAGGTASAILATNGRNVWVTDCSIRDFFGAGIVAGIYVKPPSGVTMNVFVSNSGVNGNTFGIVADGTVGGIIRGSVRNSNVSVNTNNGITASTSGSGSAVFLLHDVLLQSNGFGLVGTGTGAGFLVDQSRIFGNNIGIQASGGSAILSYGNNDLNANTTDGAFTGNIGLH